VVKAILLVALLGGCTLFEDLPDRSCKNTKDCFAAQGETCDTTKGVCVLQGTQEGGPDAQVSSVAEGSR